MMRRTQRAVPSHALRQPKRWSAIRAKMPAYPKNYARPWGRAL